MPPARYFLPFACLHASSFSKNGTHHRSISHRVRAFFSHVVLFSVNQSGYVDRQPWDHLRYTRNASDPNNSPMELRTSRTPEESVQLIYARFLIEPVLDIRIELALIRKLPFGHRVLPAIPLSVTCVQFTFSSSAPGTTVDERSSHGSTKSPDKRRVSVESCIIGNVVVSIGPWSNSAVESCPGHDHQQPESARLRHSGDGSIDPLRIRLGE